MKQIQCTFTTDDPSANALTFAFMGDIQAANDTAEDYALWGEMIRAMYERNPELSFAVLGGDMVNSGIALDEFDLVRENAKIGNDTRWSLRNKTPHFFISAKVTNQ